MKILVIGGTKFVGRHAVIAALERGHEITLFNRGLSNPALFGDVEHLTGDRDGGLDQLRGRRFDAVIDTCGYFPRLVHDSVAMLKGNVGLYMFVSTISVYEDTGADGVAEDAMLEVLEDPEVEEITAETYGGLKALCEQEVASVFGDRALIVRPGIIVGPDDHTGRFTYWPYRFGRGGRVLCPDLPEQPVQVIDVRDLAAFIVSMVERGESGVYNAVGPEHPLFLGQMLEQIHTWCNPEAEPVWVADGFLRDQKVVAFSDLPMWLSAEAQPYQDFRMDASKAKAAGLVRRPLEQTVTDIVEWIGQQGEGYVPKAGLLPAQERELLRKWLG